LIILYSYTYFTTNNFRTIHTGRKRNKNSLNYPSDLASNPTMVLSFVEWYYKYLSNKYLS